LYIALVIAAIMMIFVFFRLRKRSSGQPTEEMN
jgi:hypothetical protein